MIEEFSIPFKFDRNRFGGGVIVPFGMVLAIN